MVYADCLESDWGDLSCVGSVLFGDYLCRQDPSNPDADITFIGSYRLGPYLYRFGCTVPEQDGNNTQVRLSG